MQVSEIINQDKDLNKFINNVPDSKKSLLTGVNPGAFNAVLKQFVKTIRHPILLVE